MLTTEEPVATDEVRPYTPGGRTAIIRAELLDVTFANPTEAKAALELPGSYAPLVGGKVPDGNLPDDLVREGDLIGLGGEGGGAAPTGMISLPRVTGSSFPAVITPFTAANGAALGALPFTVLFPLIAMGQDYLAAPPAGAFHLARFAQSASSWGHAWSLVGYPQVNLQVRHYGASPSSPGNAYIRVGTVAPLAQLAAAPFSLAIVNSKDAAPKLWHNGVALETVEDGSGSGTHPVDGWATAVAEGFAFLGLDSASSIPFSGSLTPPRVVLGAFSDAEAATWGRSGVLPGWAQFSASTMEISSGTLLCGRKYRITANSGDGDFTTAGAPDNNVGTEFIVRVPAGVTPTWGTAKVVQLGTLSALQAAPQGALVLPDVSGGGRSAHLINGAASHNGERRGQFHARLSWNNTHEVKSLYGSAAHWASGRVRINSIALVASGNVTVDVGDGSTANYYADDVALTAGVPVDVALLQHIPTGLRVTVDPAANYTGTVDLICDYSLL